MCNTVYGSVACLVTDLVTGRDALLLPLHWPRWPLGPVDDIWQQRVDIYCSLRLIQSCLTHIIIRNYRVYLFWHYNNNVAYCLRRRSYSHQLCRASISRSIQVLIVGKINTSFSIDKFTRCNMLARPIHNRRLMGNERQTIDSHASFLATA